MNPIDVLFVDPIGHVLGAHDHALCSALHDAGCRVRLVTNEVHPRAADATYERYRLFERTYGDRPRIQKALNYLLALRRVVALARRRRPDGVVLYYVVHPVLDGLLVRRLVRMGIPVVLCAHDVLPPDAKGDRFGLYAHLYRRATALHVFGEFARQELVERFGCEESRVSVAPLGLEEVGEEDAIGRAAARERLGIPDGERVVLDIGTIKPSRGVEDLLTAFARIVGRAPDARLWLVGRPAGVDPRAVADKARALGIADRFELRPHHVPQERMLWWLQAADVIVRADRRIYQSGVLMQVCAVGRPIVATAVGATPELLEDGVSAWLVPPGRPDALGEALRQALEDPSEAERRARVARRRLAERCSWRRVAECLLQRIRNEDAVPLSKPMETRG